MNSSRYSRETPQRPLGEESRTKPPPCWSDLHTFTPCPSILKHPWALSGGLWPTNGAGQATTGQAAVGPVAFPRTGKYWRHHSFDLHPEWYNQLVHSNVGVGSIRANRAATRISIKQVMDTAKSNQLIHRLQNLDLPNHASPGQRRPGKRRTPRGGPGSRPWKQTGHRTDQVSPTATGNDIRWSCNYTPKNVTHHAQRSSGGISL